MQNGYSISHNGTVAEIKEVAKEQAQKVKGASPLSLLRSARTQITHAKEYELSGDLRNALSSLTKAVSLVAIVLDSPEFKTEQHGRKGDDAESSGRAVGTSIADRIRSLQNGGLAVSTTKRLSRENILSPPSFATLASPTFASSAVPSPHALVPTSSFGPPSPSSSTSSSPRMSHVNLSEFATTFPSIDELEEQDGLKLPSMPTGSSAGRVDRSLFMPPRFPALPMDPGPRPSSTPIPPTIDTFNSRPASPARFPLSPTVPQKQMDVPVTTSLFPRTLMEYNKRPNFKVLLLDVRTREEFEREHIKTDTVVCIEPSVLLRSDVTADSIENALVIAPRGEQVLFSNRDKFDVVGIYDDSSETFGDANSPLSTLTHAIYEIAFRKFLKHPPVLLVGGLQAWKREYGEAELARGEGSTAKNPGSTSSILAAVPVSSGEQGVVGRHRAGTESAVDRKALPSVPNGHYTGDQPVSIRPAHADTPLSPTIDPTRRLVRKPAMVRAASNSISYPYNPSPAIPENSVTQHVSPPPVVNGSTSIQYPTVVRHVSPQVSGSSFSSSSGTLPLPPQASINPSPLSRRRSDYVDQSQEALSGLASRAAIDYPDLSSQHVLRPPPAVASSSMERQDNRPRLMQSASYNLSNGPLTNGMPKPPTIQSDYPVTYWADIQIGTSGLKNLGNTCYMNSTIQCLSATVPFARFFTDGRWKSAVNMMNPMGTKGNLANAFATILRDMWQGESQCLMPVTFRRSICAYAPQFGGTEQHDSQEFLNFLLDGLHEDLNRVLRKPQLDTTPEREAELEKLPVQIASEQEWQIWRMRNDSLVVDFFQGQFRNRLECLTCHKTSTTYNTFMYLTLPIPTGRALSKVSLYQCLDAFVKEEVMEKSDAWNCPHCKTMRKATKTLSLSRLPPVLLIHLKRFSSKGHFTDKIETFVDYPLKNLELTNYMPPPLPPGVHNGGQQLSRDDPRAQIPPYRYDLYGVTNHFGTLSSGHYTAFISSRGGWLYCDDSRISQADPKDVVGKPAYMLFYKRIRA
ncbi:cysteine proteinase [Daedalea quercina L-15889]|uniref:ubiquitinyl hydrolase 1 n=1 Tax=Daedalea quercina L-15889 TaxID=1314783 RepID=A0A165NST1_9APHY|nr:cysteine proteinase [Daedalea quercina L-15889]